jgi:hypothetical protein
MCLKLGDLKLSLTLSMLYVREWKGKKGIQPCFEVRKSSGFVWRVR